jgi:hypothetical protein
MRGKVDLTLVHSCATRKEATQEFQVGMSSTHTKLERRGGSDRGRASSVEFSNSNFLRHSHFRASYSIHTALFRTAPQGSAHQTTLITTACSVLCDSSPHIPPKSQQEYRLRSVFLDCQAGSQTGSADQNTRKHQQHTPSERIIVYSSCELFGRVVAVFSFIWKEIIIRMRIHWRLTCTEQSRAMSTISLAVAVGRALLQFLRAEGDVAHCIQYLYDMVARRLRSMVARYCRANARRACRLMRRSAGLICKFGNDTCMCLHSAMDLWE